MYTKDIMSYIYVWFNQIFMYITSALSNTCVFI